MGTQLTRFLTEAERAAMGDASVKAGGYRNGPGVYSPGMGWFTPWVFDPQGNQGRRMMIAGPQASNAGFLSPHYWRDWAHARPPICVVGPNGEEWEVDRKSSNGDGWTVTGEWPRLTCAPSIVLTGYHGFLRDGLFTDDVEGRGPNGVAR
jgi:hypothetical protein